MRRVSRYDCHPMVIVEVQPPPLQEVPRCIASWSGWSQIKKCVCVCVCVLCVVCCVLCVVCCVLCGVLCVVCCVLCVVCVVYVDVCAFILIIKEHTLTHTHSCDHTKNANNHEPAMAITPFGRRVRIRLLSTYLFFVFKCSYE